MDYKELYIREVLYCQKRQQLATLYVPYDVAVEQTGRADTPAPHTAKNTSDGSLTPVV